MVVRRRPKAHNRAGFPDDNAVFRPDGQFVVHFRDVKVPGALVGQGLKFHGCGQCGRNLCKTSLAEADRSVARRQDAIHRAITGWCDEWGKQVCNGVEVLVVFEASSRGRVCKRIWALLARAVFSPKFSSWVLCHPDNEFEGVELFPALPLEVSLTFGPSRLNPALEAPQIKTSDEIALMVATAGEDWKARKASYDIADKPHLLTMLVKSVGEELETTKAPRSNVVNDALKDARAATSALAGTTFGEMPRVRRAAGQRSRTPRPCTSRGPSSGHAAASSTDPPLGAEQPADSPQHPPPLARPMEEEPVAPDDDELTLEVGLGDLGISEADVVEIVLGTGGDIEQPTAAPRSSEEAGETEGSSGEARGEVGNDPSEPAAAVADAGAGMEESAVGLPPPAPIDSSVFVRGPCRNGYMADSRYPGNAARLTAVWKGSVAVKCYVHSKCSQAVAEWKLPALRDLRAWAADAERTPSGASAELREQAAAKHAQAFKALLAGAVRPGRTRQGLIDEAAAVASGSAQE